MGISVNRKIKVLFIVSEFYQAGTQRFTYEVDCAIDRDKFDISILSLLPLNANKGWDDYYYAKHLALGTTIYFLNKIDVLYKPSIKERVRRKLFKEDLPSVHKNAHDFLEGFDAICFMGEYNYPILENKLTLKQKGKSLISIHNSKFQKSDNYSGFDKLAKYNFISPFKRIDDISWELSEFQNYNHTFIPLCFNVKKDNFNWKFVDSKIKKIGIFTRITYTKPLDPFIQAFYLLIQKHPDLELHLFGTGDPVEEGIDHYVKQLNLSDKVKYRGHQKNIVETGLKETLSLVWLHGYHGLPGGWAGYDICTTGIPQVFWDFGSSVDEKWMDTFPVFNNFDLFVEKSSEILTNSEEAYKLNKKQFQHVIEHNDIKKFINNLEKAYIEVAKI